MLTRLIPVLSLAFLSFLTGAAVIYFEIVPKAFLESLGAGAKEVNQAIDVQESWYVLEQVYSDQVPLTIEAARNPAPTLIVGSETAREISARVFNAQGELIQRWPINWFDVWPDADHLPPSLLPKSRPGTHPHGTLVMDNGDLLFNFESRGMVRLDACGDVVWRLPYLSHHSLFRDSRGDIWAAAFHSANGDPNKLLRKNVDKSTLLRVSPQGEVLEEVAVTDVMEKNQLQGLIYQRGSEFAMAKKISGLHLNDVEAFPENMAPGFFQPGDLMFSLRDINTVIIVSYPELILKKALIGPFVRQHDPDFVDGNTVVLFDNNDGGSRSDTSESRILKYDAVEDTWTILYSGSPEQPFFTDIMGKLQYLEDGNILVSESRRGRAFEVNAAGEMVWDYINVIGDGQVGVLIEAARLPRSFDKAFFARARDNCGA